MSGKGSRHRRQLVRAGKLKPKKHPDRASTYYKPNEQPELTMEQLQEELAKVLPPTPFARR